MVRRTMRGTSFAPLPGFARHIRRNVMMNLTESARLNSRTRAETSRNTNVWWTQVRAGLNRFAAYRAARRKHARDRQALFDFSDRELRDIGITRTDVPAVMNGTFSRD